MATILIFTGRGYSTDDAANQFVPATKSDVNGHFFSQVIYAPSVQSLVSWGTRTHAHKIRAHETQHFLIGESRWIDAFPSDIAKEWAGHFKPWGDWDICETKGAFYERDGVKMAAAVRAGYPTARLSARCEKPDEQGNRSRQKLRTPLSRSADDNERTNPDG